MFFNIKARVQQSEDLTTQRILFSRTFLHKQLQQLQNGQGDHSESNGDQHELHLTAKVKQTDTL